MDSLIAIGSLAAYLYSVYQMAAGGKVYFDTAAMIITLILLGTLEAGEELERHGFKHVFNVLHGFEGELDENHHRNAKNGWRVDGLPCQQY